jgi:hypothetical protein
MTPTLDHRRTALRVAAALTPALIALLALVPAERFWQITIACGMLSITALSILIAWPRRTRNSIPHIATRHTDLPDRLQVVEELSLHDGNRLLVVRFDDQELLFAASPSGVRLAGRARPRTTAAAEPVIAIPRAVPIELPRAAPAPAVDDHHAALHALRKRAPASPSS